ncbi:MAG TPA: MarR family transcriptional regulator [Rectinemataceae bacterium]|nr:MarR family transcriptional regulator [Rectinemataceae bacterium]
MQNDKSDKVSESLPGPGGRLADRAESLPAGHPSSHPGGRVHPEDASDSTLSPRDRQSFRIALRIREINSLANARIAEALESSGLTMPQITAIRLVAHAGSLTMSQICAEMNASPSTVAGIIDRLEAAGIVERRRSEEDRRVIFVHLAEKGSEKALFARQTMDTCFSKAFESLSDAELLEIERSVDTVLKAFKGSPYS